MLAIGAQTAYVSGMSRARLALATALVGGALVAPAADAATVTIGATLDLITAPNSSPTKTCADGTWWYAEQGIFLGNIVPPGDRGSCQFTASGFYNGAVFGLSTPVTGTAKVARIKVGAITGPMRINVVRTLFQQSGVVASPNSTTPYLQQYGPIFTPTANAVTEVPLNLPLRSQATPDPSDTGTVAGTDWLAIEVLSPNVPVPLVPYPNGTFFAAFPGPTAVNFPRPARTRSPNYGQLGYVVAMNADIDTGTASTGSTTGGGGGAAAAARRAAVPVAARVAAVPWRRDQQRGGADHHARRSLRSRAGQARRRAGAQRPGLHRHDPAGAQVGDEVLRQDELHAQSWSDAVSPRAAQLPRAGTPARSLEGHRARPRHAERRGDADHPEPHAAPLALSPRRGGVRRWRREAPAKLVGRHADDAPERAAQGLRVGEAGVGGERAQRPAVARL